MTGLEALKEFKGNNNTMLVGRVMGKQHYLDCLQVMEKSLKALEIIKKKKVNVYNEIMTCKNYAEYLECDGITLYKLTQEEFELLKEVLE